MKHCHILILFLLLPSIVSGQAMTVFGGEGQARECFNNANLTSNLPDISNAMIEPCDYALELTRLNNKDRAATYANRGILLMAQGKFDEALDSYDQALILTPDSGEVYVNRGNAWFMNRNYSAAMDDYLTAMDAGIKDIHKLHFNIGLTHERLGNPAKAEEAYREALRINPEWSVALDKLNALLESLAE